ncbi:MAG TPA: DNA translocase FtsK 4TM domain-containing protein, partial [Thermomicrobiales bacterium]|nr:DNA translocase FtsK 4TM domain-containing protein [Thermomicrobiales bacterium]
MAARAKTKSAQQGTTRRVGVAAQPVPSRPSRSRRALRRAGGWFASIDIPPRLREELIAFAIFTAAVIAALPLVGMAGGSALDYVGSAIHSLFGRAGMIVPLGLSVIAVEIWRAGDAGQRVRRIVGGVVTVASVVGLITLGQSDRDVSETGGAAGWAVATGLMQLLGEVGAGLTLIALGFAGVFLVTGYTVREIAESWQRVRPRRALAAGDWDVDDTELPLDAPPVEEPDMRSGTAPFQRAATSEMPVVAEPVAVPVAPVTPVIKVPKPDRPAPVATAATEPDEIEFEPRSVPKGKWKLPSVAKLALYKSSEPDASDLEGKAKRIEETLASFKVEAKVREVFPGPAVTLFTVQPGAGVKVRRITELQNDLALALAAPSIRIEAPVPGMARVGIEIPNASISTVGLRETLESSGFTKSSAKLPVPLGRDVNGRYIVGDLAKMPHLLIAGATGSGKSVCLNGIIATFLLTKTPDDLKLIMIDPKMVEMAGYEGVPHLQSPVVTEMNKVVSALRAVLREMERRYQLFSRLGVRNIDGYELRRSTEPTLEKMPYMVVIIDELADLMMTTPDEVETILVRLAQMARATGIHLIIATQRPTVDVLTGLIKANVPARIAFAVTSLTDSRVILDVAGAERLLGRGDMLFMPPDAAKPYRIQGSYIDDENLQQIVKHWRLLAPETIYEPEWAQLPTDSEAEEGSEDPLMEQALTIVRQQGTASASMLQRRLRIGYNRAA